MTTQTSSTDAFALGRHYLTAPAPQSSGCWPPSPACVATDAAQTSPGAPRPPQAPSTGCPSTHAPRRYAPTTAPGFLAYHLNIALDRTTTAGHVVAAPRRAVVAVTPPAMVFSEYVGGGTPAMCAGRIAGVGLLVVAALVMVYRRRRSRAQAQAGAGAGGRDGSPQEPFGPAATADSGSRNGTDTLVSPPAIIPEPVRALVYATRSYQVPEATDDLRRFIDGLDPGTAPVSAELVDAVLCWIVTAPPDDPRLPDWADYAQVASTRLHGGDHSQIRRAALAHAAVGVGLLTARAADGDVFYQVEEVIKCVVDTSEASGDEIPTGRLTAYLTLHAYGRCDTAIAEVTRTLRTWPRDPVCPAASLTIMVVLTAMLTACGRVRDARHFLDAFAGDLGPPGSRLRDLFAVCAITVTDVITAPHAPVCTRDQPTYDRHAWSAMAHGEDPDQYLCVPPARRTPRPGFGRAGARSPYDLSLSELADRFSYQYERPQNIAARSFPDSTHAAWGAPADLWLLCEDCHLALLLGDTTVLPARPGIPIGQVLIAGRPAWQHGSLVAAIRRLLHDHLGHHLRALTDRSPDWHTQTATAMDLIDRPPACIGTATWSLYADGWPHRPTLADYRGATPRPVVAEPHAETYLICASCGLELVLGECTIDQDTSRDPAKPVIAITDLGTTVTAVMRLVTEHAGHDLLLLADDPSWQDYFASAGWADTIRADPSDAWAIGDITRAQYIDGWPDSTLLPRYRGFDPAGASAVAWLPARHTRRPRPCCAPTAATPEAADA